MAEAVTIDVQARDAQKNRGTGSRVSRRLRASGRIPAIIYGHKQAPVPISVSRDDVWMMIKKAHHLAELRLGGQTEMALVREIQWDHLGKEIIHLDFFRVSATEKVTTTVPLKLHGTAPGLSEGGLIEQPLHEISVTAAATSIPDAIQVEMGEVHVNQSVHVRDLKLPEGVTTDADPDLVLVHIVSKAAVAAAAAEEETGAEPSEVEPTEAGEATKEGEE
ncbi:MAG TPA: 50S ribosomal protein L25 [Isosphaeraceae bacterium]|nr:50S ribosomal protein L25 [Isosphaeraceae bacterium]